ncbi:MAG: FAD-dependent oxidoreductase, partial [Nocardioidaceae bacterium]|nr:FAD-dependent oxidoreductase [Nocardioidaceae bacterium]
ELNTSRVAFAGAYHGWGFHEDGALSGRLAAEHLGGRWETVERPKPAPTPRLYTTRIKHARVEPQRNIFSYDSYTWLVDLDDLPQYAGAFAPVLRRLASFEARDHVGDPDRSLRANIEAVLAEHDVELGDGSRIQMLAHARTLGYVFNPISVFWCHRADSSLAAVVVEVHNTYGGRHAYVVHPDEHGRATVAKQLYVSPFNDTSGEYHVAVPLPGDTVTVGVTLHRDGRPPFTATMTGTAGPADARSVVRASFRHPVVPLLGMARIKFQGVKLWLRGLSVQPRPPGDPR